MRAGSMLPVRFAMKKKNVQPLSRLRGSYDAYRIFSDSGFSGPACQLAFYKQEEQSSCCLLCDSLIFLSLLDAAVCPDLRD